ncbi:MAG: hypothetical protein AAF901_07915 [Bacteroidota bacterium]
MNKAQEELSKKGGGTIFFPEGTYEFDDHILLKKGIVIRGVDPVNLEKFNPIVPEDLPQAYTDAREARYALGTRFIFPKYAFSKNKSRDQALKEAFKGIRLENPEEGEYAGVVNIHVENGHIALGEKEAQQQNYREGNKRGHFLVFGCILTNTAIPAMNIPQEWQPEWQLFPDVEYGAITVYGGQNILIANNRIPEDNSNNFVMEDFKVFNTQADWKNQINVTTQDVPFDYENRSGIRVNWMPLLKQLAIWKIYDELDEAVKNGTHEEYVTPGGLVKGIVIRNNYVYSSGHGGIKSSGDGTYIAFNIVRTRPSVVLPTRNGLFMDAHVNDIRGIEVRGWRWTIEGNDFDVHANYTPDGIKYNDGEGLMHEAWENVGVRDSRMINNVGNRYLCFWRIPVRGLEISGNRVRTRNDWHAIYVNAQSRPNSATLLDLPCEGVKIINNLTECSGIKIVGENGKGNQLIGNRHSLIGQAKLEDYAKSKIKNNQQYEVIIGN